MSLEQIASAVWRRRALFLVAFVLCVAAVAAVTYRLPRTYKATATLYVGLTDQASEAVALDANLAEQLARTYTTLASNPNVADAVVARLPFDTSRRELLGSMSFAPVQRTQLLEISATAKSRERAQLVANLYANTFVDRVRDQFARGRTPTTIAVSEPATRPASAAKPNPPLYLGLGSLLALLAATAAALVRERLDDRIEISEVDEEILGRPVLGWMPEHSARRSATSLEVADGGRLLKANIDFVADSPTKVLAVTSAAPGEGKSTLVALLALAAVSDGERVVVLEADLRRPGLWSTPVGLPGTYPRAGFSTYLAGAAAAGEIAIPHPTFPGLEVIPAGPLPPNPSALLRTRQVERLLEHLRGRHDRILIDTPPIALGADASVAVLWADGTLFVVDARRSRRLRVQAGLAQLDTARANLLGVVVNRSPLRIREHYGYYAEMAAPANGSGFGFRGRRQRRRARV